MSKKINKIQKRFDKQIIFIQCNFRIVLTLMTIALVVIAFISICNHPFIKKLSSDIRFAAIYALITTIILLLVIIKTIRDYIAIKFQHKGKGSLIEKTSIKRK